MIAVLFEVIPNEGKKEKYLDIAYQLRGELEKISGFISIERFQSLQDENKILSLSFWKDEKSVKEWRNLEKHREAQASGRTSVFADYRLRVADVLRDYGMNERAQVPSDSKTYHQKKN
ncbi:MAG: antibiotic biosynthesis monooxygenase [Cyclobacteriaceae bacterium]